MVNKGLHGTRRTYLLAAALLLLAGIGAASIWAFLGAHDERALVARRAPHGRVNAELRSVNGVPELWLVPVDGSPEMVTAGTDDEGVRDNFVWSPRRSLLAFETYNVGGHSPLTTSHVWIVGADGTGLAKVTLPPPNERFSTHIGQWIDDNTLDVRANLLSEDDVNFTFEYSSREVRRSSNP